MKKSLCFIAVVAMLIIANTAFAQQKYPKGLYMSYEEIINQSPSVLDDIVLIKRSHGDISMVGGNDYKLESSTLDKKVLKRNAFAYSDGDTLYINCMQYDAQPWYAKVYSVGDYLLFDAGISKKSQKTDKVGLAVASAVLGGFGGAISGAKAAHIRYHYALKLDGNVFDIVNIDLLNAVMSHRGGDMYEEYMRNRDFALNCPDKKKKKELLANLAEKYIPYINMK